jgi:hypothetical protein
LNREVDILNMVVSRAIGSLSFENQTTIVVDQMGNPFEYPLTQTKLIKLHFSFKIVNHQ